MLTPAELAGAFARNVAVLKMQADGLTDADSLLQPPFRGNCLNWVIGHILTSRDDVLEALGEARVMGAAGSRYARESDAVTAAGEGVLPLAELLAWLDEAQARTAAALDRLDEDALAREIAAGERKTTVAKRLFFLYFHETYHVGQAELLRQLAGKNDKVI